MLKKVMALLCLSFILPACQSTNVTKQTETAARQAQPNQFQKSWQYLAKANASERWGVISAKAKQGYFQCANYDDIVRCDIPVWTKLVKHNGSMIGASNCGGQALPELAGAKAKSMLSQQQVDKAYAVFKKYGLQAFEKHCHVITPESNQPVGTLMDLGVLVDFHFDKFEALSKDYLKAVYGIDSSDGYQFSTN